MMEKLRIIVGGYIGLYPTGGATIDYIQYPLGLKLLGHDVYYIEDTLQYPVFQKNGNAWNDASDCVSYLKEVMEKYGFENRWAYRDFASGNCFGLSIEKVKELCASADVFINISCSTYLREEYMSIPKRLLIDSDPMFTQIQYCIEREQQADAKNWSTKQMVEGHNYLFSFGENISSADCEIPTLGYRWIPTRQPICTNLWADDAGNRDMSAFTSIMNWSGRKKLAYNGDTWGQKDIEFEKFSELPQKIASEKFEVVINRPLNKDSTFDKQRLQGLGWKILDPSHTVATSSDYQNFIFSSLAEFSVAKESYVKSNSGWFSCRSACYLAAGKPVVTQETAWSKFIPSGYGLFSFTNMEDALEAIHAINTDLVFHRNQAQEIAYEYFDSNIVLTKLIESIN